MLEALKLTPRSWVVHSQLPTKLYPALLEELQAMGAAVESDKWAAGDKEKVVLFAVEPGAFRRCDGFVRQVITTLSICTPLLSREPLEFEEAVSYF